MARLGTGNKLQQQTADTFARRLDKIDRQGRLSQHAVTNLTATINASTNGVQVSFTVRSLQGLDSVILMRNLTRDPGGAKVLANWTQASLLALGTKSYPVTYSDADPTIVSAIACYWVKVVPASDAKAQSYLVGPTVLDQSQTASLSLTLASKAPLNSPAFTGTPTAPTPATADNTTKLATTAFVKAQAYAPLASPALTGAPTAPTPAAGDSSTKLATTAFVAPVSGITANRPVTTVVGTFYFDTTLNKPIWWNGANWVDATGTNV